MEHLQMWFCVFALSLLARGDTQEDQSKRTCEHGLMSQNAEKASGDGNFRIRVLGTPTPESYIPGTTYSIQISGPKTPLGAHQFIGFVLTASVKDTNTAAGQLQPVRDGHSKYSHRCQYAIVSKNSNVKNNARMVWVAPPSGTGCVVFRALVAVSTHKFHEDEGGLEKEFCESGATNEITETETVQVKDCCACDEAKYEITFEGIWSRNTHPKDYPENLWVVHWSNIIGATHSKDYTMWELGGYASDGTKDLAEFGKTGLLERELKLESGNIRTIIKARGLWYPTVVGKTYATARTDKQHHLLSLLTMLGPSPDWTAGVSSLDLCLSNCSWIENMVIGLTPIDMGTDTGISYNSENQPTLPREKIHEITSSYPNNPASPFWNEDGTPISPLAKLYIERKRVYERPCNATFDNEVTDENTIKGPMPPKGTLPPQADKCAVTSWSDWSTCSVTCGKGMATRRRAYYNPEADAVCTKELMEKGPCMTDIDCRSVSSPKCAVHHWGDWTPCSATCGQGQTVRVRLYENEQAAQMMGCDINMIERKVCTEGTRCDSCATTEWSSWSQCSATCGMGMKIRNRMFLDKETGMKMCDEELMEKEPCKGEYPSCDMNPLCQVTKWSTWSPCSVTCGKGFTIRTRLLFNQAGEDVCDLPLMEKNPCMADVSDCALDTSQAGEICNLPRESGPCRGYFIRWYYNSDMQRCGQFWYGGCRGNRNNFENYEACKMMCEMTQTGGSSTSVGFDYNTLPQPTEATTTGVIDQDCVVSNWFEWTPCSATCGRGRRTRQRMIKQQPLGNGTPCPNKLTQTRKCKLQRCPIDCKMTQWSEWSRCSKSCGNHGIKLRTRTQIRKPRRGGRPCGSSLERVYCTDLPPCF